MSSSSAIQVFLHLPLLDYLLGERVFGYDQRRYTEE